MIFKSVYDKKDITMLTPFDLFDRVINVRLNMVNPSKENAADRKIDSIVIRSDYEIVYKNFDVVRMLREIDLPIKEYTIQKCIHKPSIKVNYKRITGNTVVQLDLFIDNFYSLTKDNNFIMQFNSRNYKVRSVDIMLGYAGQFALNSPKFAQDYMVFNPVAGVTLLKNCEVLYVTQDKLPPDGTLHINAVVGNITTAPIDFGNSLKVDYEALDATKLKVDYSVETGAPLDKILFDNITRRFSKYSVIPKELQFNYIKDPITGFLEEFSARVVGVECIVSPEAKKIKIQKLVDSNGKAISNKVLSIDTQADLLSCFSQINTQLFSGALFSTILNDGSLLVYTKEELTDFDKRELLVKMLAPRFAQESTFWQFQNRLPAVYNIVTGVVAYITCPFFFLVSPFQEIKFKNRYSTGSAVAYFTDFTAKESVFYAISVSVAFATVEDVNEMQIDCVTRKEKQ